MSESTLSRQEGFAVRTTLVILATILVSGCASAFAKKCSRWGFYTSYPELQIGVVERHDIYRCTSFSEVP